MSHSMFQRISLPRLVAACLVTAGVSGAAQATLIDRGGGLIYDQDRDITWLQNANINGTMTWSDANAWATGLSYGGYTDWRLPTSLNADATGPCSGFNCIGSEMGHLFYAELGGTVGSSILASADPDLALFSNIQSGFYWSGTEYAPDPSRAWYFYAGNGGQGVSNKADRFYALAVRPGDVAAVAAVPEPATLMLLGLGLAGLGVMRRR